MRQTKSKQRIRDHGEVFTAEREVNAMIDLVADEATRANTRFLEPTCGTGNFLVAILKRKLDATAPLYDKSPATYQQTALTALASIYGIDILQDNVVESQLRLLDTLKTEFNRVAHHDLPAHCDAVAHDIVSTNIVCGDFLTAKTHKKKPIIVTEWEFTEEEQVSRREFRLDELMMAQEQSLFTSLWEGESDGQCRNPNPIRVYPKVSYKNNKPIKASYHEI